MNRSKLTLSIAVCLLPLMASVGCVRHRRVVVVHETAPAAQPAPAAEADAEPPAEDDGAAGEVAADSDLPEEQVETPPPRPSSRHMWVKGRWHWAGRWVWKPGHYVVIRTGHTWVPGHWEHRRNRKYVWVRGHWSRR